MDESKHRWFCPAPSWLVYGSILATGLLFLSERWQWFPFNAHKGWTVLVAVAGVGAVLAVMLAWWVVALVFRRRFQFGIRTLLVLVVAVALPSSWLAVCIQQARRQAAAVVVMRDEFHAGVAFDTDWHFDGFVQPGGTSPPVPETLKKLLGTDFFSRPIKIEWGCTPSNDSDYSRVICDGSDNAMDLLRDLSDVKQIDQGGANFWYTEYSGEAITDSGFIHLRALTQLACLDLSCTHVTDAGLENLHGLRQLKKLWLNSDRVTGSGLAGLTALEVLCLRAPQLTDAGLAHLAKLTQLESLDIEAEQVTDAGLSHLEGMTSLRFLNLHRTKVTSEGGSKLQRALPKCQVDVLLF